MRISNAVTTLAVFGLLTAGVAFGQPKRLKGVVSDTACGAHHGMTGSAAKCTRECVKRGSSYALVVGDKVYKLNGHSKELYNLAGEDAVVTGTVSGTNVNVRSVSPAS
jgi:hypothetical protein